MDVEQTTVQAHEDLFPVSFDCSDTSTGQALDGCDPIAPGHANGSNVRRQDGLSHQVRRDGADNSFYFGKFGQVGTNERATQA